MKTIYGTFAYRVKFAAAVISSGRSPTRSFDNCFEMDDGEAVVVAVYRRSRHNPKIRANIWRYLNRQLTVRDAFRYRHLTTRQLPALATMLASDAEARRNKQFAQRKVK